MAVQQPVQDNEQPYATPSRRPNFELARASAYDLIPSPAHIPPVPVKEIAEEFVSDIVFTDFGKYTDDISGLLDFRERIIYVNSKDKFEKQSFTIAHELGHWLLHRKHHESYNYLPRMQNIYADNLGPLELEANCFALNLLIPSTWLSPLVESRDFSNTELANIFNVSLSVMNFRLKNLSNTV